MKLSEITKILKVNSDLVGSDSEFTNLSIDTRSLKKGDFFIAIKGPNFDGHDFVTKARKLGASGALVGRHIDAVTLSQVVVQDVRIALGELGAWQRARFNIPLIAVTGTCGKTTTKEMVAAILRQCGDTLASVKSFNTDIGVPLILWQLQKRYQYAVLEVGANHFEEIQYLTKLIKPQVAVITNAGAGHLEGFGDIRGVARAKGEIFEGLTNDGVAILNADDKYFDYWRGLVSKHEILTFGLKDKADVKAIDIQIERDGKPSFILQLPKAQAFVKLPLLGQHNVANALAAASATYALGAPIDAIKYGLENVQSVYMRLIKHIGLNGVEIIDDSYNAIPNAVIASLQILARNSKQKIFVFGGMRELGDTSKWWHYEIGTKARELGVDYLYTFGEFADQIAIAFGEGAKVFPDKKQLIVALKEILDARKVVLIKGARGSKMEEVVKALLMP